MRLRFNHKIGATPIWNVYLEVWRYGFMFGWFNIYPDVGFRFYRLSYQTFLRKGRFMMGICNIPKAVQHRLTGPSCSE
jgi:hypothetical protein